MIMQALSDPQTIAMLLAAVAAAATVFTIAMPLLAGDNLDKRLKAVAVERERIRQRERERLVAEGQGRGSLRQKPAEKVRRFVEQFKLRDWLGTEDAKNKLIQAGFRGQKAEYGFLVSRFFVPVGFTIVATFYLFVVDDFDLSFIIRVAIVIFATYLGVKAPEIYLKNAIDKRRTAIKRAWPDALDLLLICAESGSSIEQGFRKVSTEMGPSAFELAEEMALTTAELSYLPDRKLAYENLANRVGLDTVKSVATALIQAERYGTPIGQALRVLSQESRDMRMNEAEKKAAGLPPKLTVPMILFFLPVLFAVIMTPAMIQIFEWQ
ncbi:MAG: type II secretion system F family protein [Salinarimonadaceae bacterium]|nr:MAG: type II secretion system F family protein [Salinarimonadaceae bacterium]